jgi:dihydrodipicolinate synthase/N-acetylneuraminate lyase
MLARDYPHIAAGCGMDDQALEFFAWGARLGLRGSNFAPEAHIALYRACVVEGDFTKGRAIMSAMLPLMRVLEQGGKFVQCIKHGLTLRGIRGPAAQAAATAEQGRQARTGGGDPHAGHRHSPPLTGRGRHDRVC